MGSFRDTKITEQMVPLLPCQSAFTFTHQSIGQGFFWLQTFKTSLGRILYLFTYLFTYLFKNTLLLFAIRIIEIYGSNKFEHYHDIITIAILGVVRKNLKKKTTTMDLKKVALVSFKNVPPRSKKQKVTKQDNQIPYYYKHHEKKSQVFRESIYLFLASF